LYHEHQNEAFWSEPYSQSGGDIFDQSRWKCQNLKDYNTVLNRLIAEKGQATAQSEMEVACRRKAAAEVAKFSAAEYLPITNDPVLASKKGIDWESIMIYPSGAGGSGSAAGGNDQRTPILLKPDGSLIPINLRPSARDVGGLKKLYAYNQSSPWTPLNDLKNSAKSKMDAILRRNPDSGCV
jgi:hypothetical protein